MSGNTEDEMNQPLTSEPVGDDGEKVVVDKKGRKKKKVSAEQVADEIVLDCDADDFLNALQTTTILAADPNRLCFKGHFALSPSFKFYILIVAFLIPSLISIAQIAMQSPAAKRTYIDGCVNTTDSKFPNGTTKLLPFSTCLQCNEGLSFVSSSHLEYPPALYPMRYTAIVFSIIFGLVAGAIYSRLAFSEYLALRLLAFSVLVTSDVNASQMKPVIISLICALVVGGFVAATLLYVNGSLANILLYYSRDPKNHGEGASDNALYATCRGVIAYFEEGQNVSVLAQPLTPMHVLQVLVTAILPFLLVVIKIYGAATSTFTTIGLEDLIKNAEYGERVLKYVSIGVSVNEDALLEAISEFAETCEPEPKTVGNILRRIIIFDFNFSRPPPAFFSWSWGSRFVEQDRADVQRITGFSDKQFEEEFERFLPEEPDEEDRRYACGLVLEEYYTCSIFKILAKKHKLHEYSSVDLWDAQGYKLIPLEDSDDDDDEDEDEEEEEEGEEGEGEEETLTFGVFS